MVPKFKFGGAVLLVLLGLAGIVGSLQVFSPKTVARSSKIAKSGVILTPKFFANQSMHRPTVTAKLRNPFVPMHINTNEHDSTMPNVSQSPIPNAPPPPVLRGILEQSGRKFAIIEYNNKSHICAIGNNVSSYTLTGLTAFSAFLEEKNGNVIEIRTETHK